MTFNQAYKYAMEHSERFRRHDAAVKKAKKAGEKSACMIFAVSPGESFYYGFDGCDMQKGKHTKKTTDLLAKTGLILIIL